MRQHGHMSSYQMLRPGAGSTAMAMRFKELERTESQGISREEEVRVLGGASDRFSVALSGVVIASSVFCILNTKHPAAKR